MRHFKNEWRNIILIHRVDGTRCAIGYRARGPVLAVVVREFRVDQFQRTAFAIMRLEPFPTAVVQFDQAAAANEVFNRYLAGAGDEGLEGLRLLPLFLSMRAAIRAHVLFMKSEQAGGSDAVWREAKRYFDLVNVKMGQLVEETIRKWNMIQ